MFVAFSYSAAAIFSVIGFILGYTTAKVVEMVKARQYIKKDLVAPLKKLNLIGLVMIVLVAVSLFTLYQNQEDQTRQHRKDVHNAAVLADTAKRLAVSAASQAALVESNKQELACVSQVIDAFAQNSAGTAAKDKTLTTLITGLISDPDSSNFRVKLQVYLDSQTQLNATRMKNAVTIAKGCHD